MQRISDRFLQIGVLCALIGMAMGVGMGMKEDFTLAPAHAHLNLLGWASMMLYGLFYRVVPSAGASRLAFVHFWVALAGVAILVPALALKLLGHTEATPVLAAGSVVTLLSMAIFAVVVFGHTRRTKAVHAS